MNEQDRDEMYWAIHQDQVHKMQCHELAEHRFLSVFNDLLTHYGLTELQKLGIDIFGGCVNVS